MTTRAETDRALRRQLIQLLKTSDAHIGIDEATRNFPPELRGRRPERAAHSPWQVLEHMRICQWDMLEFSRDPKHESPSFPDGYWPKSESPPDDTAWDRSVAAFKNDLLAMQRLVSNPKRDLFARINHPDAKAKHTLIREALVLVDHNAYHLGELLLLRRLLGAWPTS